MLHRAVSRASVAICSSYFIHSIIPWGINSDEATINGLTSGGECQQWGSGVREVWRLEWGGRPCPLHQQLHQHLALHLHQPPVLHCVWCGGHGWVLYGISAFLCFDSYKFYLWWCLITFLTMQLLNWFLHYSISERTQSCE